MQFWWRTHHVFLDPFLGSTMPTLRSCLAWMDQKGKRLHPKHSQALGDPGILYPTAPEGPGPCTLRHGVIRGSCIPQLPACLGRLPPLLQCHPHRGKAAPSILFYPTRTQAQWESSSFQFPFLSGNSGASSVAGAPWTRPRLDVEHRILRFLQVGIVAVEKLRAGVGSAGAGGALLWKCGWDQAQMGDTELSE